MDRWAIKKDEETGVIHAIPGVDGVVSLSVLPDGAYKVFMRNGIIKNLKTGITTKKRWLVGELNGVRCYVQGTNVIMTVQDKYP